MRLPNAESAVVDIAKLRDYCLNVDHPRGQHKARLFTAALGITAENADELRELFLLGIVEQDAIRGVSDAYGERYSIDMPLTRRGRKATVRTAWIVKRGKIFHV